MSTLYDMPGHLFRRIHQISTAIFAEECAAYGVTSVQYAALVAIRENPAVDATRLSTLIAFDRSTLGDVLERLEARGWIVRSPSPNDRRVKLLTLSPAGENVLVEIGAAVRRVQHRLLAPLGARDGARVVELLTQLIEAHGGASEAASHPSAKMLGGQDP